VREGLTAPDGWVTCGIDLAKKEDFTVITASNAATALPCVYERWNAITWPEQERLIAGVIEELEADPAVEGVTVAVDSGGVGDVVFDHLEEMGLDVVPINFSGPQLLKERMVRLLAADLEHGRAFITEEMRDEHEHYEYEINPNGRYQFAAPEGEHDDKVAAKLMEHWAVVHEAPPGIKLYDPEQPDPEADEPEEPEVDEGTAEEIVPDSPRQIALRPEAWSS